MVLRFFGRGMDQELGTALRLTFCQCNQPRGRTDTGAKTNHGSWVAYQTNLKGLLPLLLSYPTACAQAPNISPRLGTICLATLL